MSLSKFNQMWFDIGRTARLQAQLQAALTNTAVHLHESSYYATAASYWRQGWNSVTLADIKKHINEHKTTRQASAMANIANARAAIGATQ